MSAAFELKYLIARMAFENPARFLATFGAGDRTYLLNLWLGTHPDASERDADAISVKNHHGVLVLRLPTPTERNEPFAIAIIGDASALRVFLLEKAADARVAAFVAEIAPTHRANMGPLEDTRNETFAARVLDIVHPAPEAE